MALARSRSFRSSSALPGPAIEAPDCRMGDFVAGACILRVAPWGVKRKRIQALSVASCRTATCRDLPLSPRWQKCADSTPCLARQTLDFCTISKGRDRVGLVPSPVGHALGGIAIAWPVVPRKNRQDALILAAIAIAPDLDLLFETHRGESHSVGAAAIAGLIVGLFAFAAAPLRRDALRWGVAAALAWGSHVLLD